MKNYGKWFFVGVAFVLLLCAASTAIEFQRRHQAVKQAGGMASRFLSALNAHDYITAHALLAASRQQVVSLAAMQAPEEKVEKKHGKPAGQFMLDEYHPNGDLTVLTLFYENAYQRPSEPIQIIMVKIGGRWCVQEYHYDVSPA